MAELLTDFDPAAMLETDQAVEVFLLDAFETGDARHIASALGAVARAKGKAGQIYKLLGDAGNPTLAASLAVMKAIGFDMTGKRHAA